MTKSFQKTATGLQELHLPHSGIIHSKAFNKHFELHCYEPSADLKPFVVHIWTQRRKGDDHPVHIPTEILSGPNLYLFLTADTAFIHGITSGKFTYDPLVSDVVAGVKFRPGGFYPFAKQPISHLASQTPLSSVFPEVDKLLQKNLLDQSDELIVAALENLLRSKSPADTGRIDLVAKILAALDTDTSLQSVKRIADTFCMSERSLQLLFQTHVGVGIKWIITRRRLLEVIQRVQGKNYPSWTEIAAELGYSSQSHFSRDFKKVTGQSPSQYLSDL